MLIQDSNGWQIAPPGATPAGAQARVNSSERSGPTTAEVEALCALFRHPGWTHYKHYLKKLRQDAARELIYRLDAGAHATHLSARQAEIRLIDKILGEAGEPSKVLAHKIHDAQEVSVRSPYRGEDAQEQLL